MSDIDLEVLFAHKDTSACCINKAQVVYIYMEMYIIYIYYAYIFHVYVCIHECFGVCEHLLVWVWMCLHRHHHEGVMRSFTAPQPSSSTGTTLRSITLKLRLERLLEVSYMHLKHVPFRHVVVWKNCSLYLHK